MGSGSAAFVARWDDAFNSAPETAADLFAEGASYTDHRPLGWEPMHGRDAIRIWFGSLSNGGASIRADSRVLAEHASRIAAEQDFRIVASEADGGGIAEVAVWVVLRVEDGLIATLDLFGDRDTALAALQAGAA